MLVAEVNGADQNSMLADSSKPCAEGAAWCYPQTEDATENARLRARVAELEAQVELLKRPPSSNFTSLHVHLPHHSFNVSVDVKLKFVLRSTYNAKQRNIT